MFIGHYGAAYALKRWRPEVSLFTLFIGVQLLDVGWAVLVMAGVEKVRIVPGFTATNPLDLYYMPYTHGLIAALVWAAIAGSSYALIRRHATAAGVAVGLAVFSHWVFDFIVHRPDLPLYDNSAKVGLGLWNYRGPAFALEIALLVAGLVLYLAGTRGRDRIGRVGPWVFVGVLIGVQMVLFFGPPPGSPSGAAATALVAYVAFAAIARWIVRHRG